MGTRMLAYAKINLGLEVGPRDALGYHAVDTVFAQIGLYDELTVDPADHWELTVQGPFADVVPQDASNSVCQAERLLAAGDEDWPQAWRVNIEKAIPTGAGLAGGSADAAAFLRFAQAVRPQLAPILATIAPKLGMDVPFCLLGGIARGQRYGERLTPLELGPWPGWRILLLNPGWVVSTGLVYHAFDTQTDSGPSVDIAAICETIRRGRIPDNLANGLEDAAHRVEPRLKEFKSWIESLADGVPCWLSGSGATYYMIIDDEERGEWLYRRMQSHKVPWVWLTALASGDPG